MEGLEEVTIRGERGAALRQGILATLLLGALLIIIPAVPVVLVLLLFLLLLLLLLPQVGVVVKD